MKGSKKLAYMRIHMSLEGGDSNIQAMQKDVSWKCIVNCILLFTWNII